MQRQSRSRHNISSKMNYDNVAENPPEIIGSTALNKRHGSRLELGSSKGASGSSRKLTAAAELSSKLRSRKSSEKLTQVEAENHSVASVHSNHQEAVVAEITAALEVTPQSRPSSIDLMMKNRSGKGSMALPSMEEALLFAEDERDDEADLKPFQSFMLNPRPTELIKKPGDSFHNLPNRATSRALPEMSEEDGRLRRSEGGLPNSQSFLIVSSNAAEPEALLSSNSSTPNRAKSGVDLPRSQSRLRQSTFVQKLDLAISSILAVPEKKITPPVPQPMMPLTKDDLFPEEKGVQSSSVGSPGGRQARVTAVSVTPSKSNKSIAAMSAKRLSSKGSASIESTDYSSHPQPSTPSYSVQEYRELMAERMLAQTALFGDGISSSKDQAPYLTLDSIGSASPEDFVDSQQKLQSLSKKFTKPPGLYIPGSVRSEVPPKQPDNVNTNAISNAPASSSSQPVSSTPTKKSSFALPTSLSSPSPERRISFWPTRQSTTTGAESKNFDFGEGMLEPSIVKGLRRASSLITQSLPALRHVAEDIHNRSAPVLASLFQSPVKDKVGQDNRFDDLREVEHESEAEEEDEVVYREEDLDANHALLPSQIVAKPVVAQSFHNPYDHFGSDLSEAARTTPVKDSRGKSKQSRNNSSTPDPRSADNSAPVIYAPASPSSRYSSSVSNVSNLTQMLEIGGSRVKYSPHNNKANLSNTPQTKWQKANSKPESSLRRIGASIRETPEDGNDDDMGEFDNFSHSYSAYKESLGDGKGLSTYDWDMHSFRVDKASTAELAVMTEQMSSLLRTSSQYSLQSREKTAQEKLRKKMLARYQEDPQGELHEELKEIAERERADKSTREIMADYSKELDSWD